MSGDNNTYQLDLDNGQTVAYVRRYKTQIHKPVYEEDEEDEPMGARTEWIDGPTLLYGHTTANVPFLAVVDEVTVHDPSNPYHYHSLPGTYVFKKNGRFQINVSAAMMGHRTDKEPLQPFYDFIRYTAKIDEDNGEVKGKAFAYDVSAEGFVGQPHYWHGNYVDTIRYAPYREGQVEPDARGPAELDEVEIQARLHVLATTDFNMDQLDMKAMTIVRNAMMYHMDPDIRQTVFNRSKPELNDQDQLSFLGDGIDDDRKAFLERFGYAYAGKLVSNLGESDKYRNMLTLEERVKINYYMSGSDAPANTDPANPTYLMMTDKAYMEINEIASISIFKQMNPVLAPFLANGNGPAWAARLYEWLINPNMLNHLSEQVLESGTGKLKQLSMALLALTGFKDKNKDERYDVLLWQKTFQQKLKNAVPYFQTVGTVKEMTKWISDALGTAVDQILNLDGDANLDFQSLQSEVNALVTKLQNREALDRKNAAQTVVTELDSAAQTIAQYFATEEGPFWSRLSKALESPSMTTFFTEKLGGRLLAGTAKILFGIALHGVAMAAISMGYMNWSQLSDTQKTQTVINTVTLGVQYIVKAKVSIRAGWPGFKSKVQGIGSSISEKVKSWAKVEEEFEMEPLVKNTLKEDETFERASYYGAINDMKATAKGSKVAEEEAAAVEVSELAKMTNMESRVMKIAGFLALAAGAVLDGMDIYFAAQKGDTAAVAMDSLGLVSTALMAVSEVAGIIAVDSALTVLGPVGLALGIVVGVVGLIMYLTHHDDPQPDLLQTYLASTIKPFLAHVPAQPYPEPPAKATLTPTGPAYNAVTVEVEPGYIGPAKATLDGYTLVVSLAQGNTVTNAVIPQLPTTAQASPINVTGLTPGAKYQFNVQAWNKLVETDKDGNITNTVQKPSKKSWQKDVLMVAPKLATA